MKNKGIKKEYYLKIIKKQSWGGQFYVQIAHWDSWSL